MTKDCREPVRSGCSSLQAHARTPPLTADPPPPSTRNVIADMADVPGLHPRPIGHASEQRSAGFRSPSSPEVVTSPSRQPCDRSMPAISEAGSTLSDRYQRRSGSAPPTSSAARGLARATSNSTPHSTSAAMAQDSAAIRANFPARGRPRPARHPLSHRLDAPCLLPDPVTRQKRHDC